MQSLTIKDIEDLINKRKLDDKLINELKEDKRVGVQRLLERAIKKQEELLRIKEKSKQMLAFESKVWDKGYEFVGGIDEAGRGPLAGPVVAACVILPKGLTIEGVDDSKKLSPSKREFFYNIINEKAVTVGLGIVDQDQIDKVNIYSATLQAMQKAVASCGIRPEYLLVDAMRLPACPISQASITSGDTKSQSIAAASIIAKVTRDRLMVDLSNDYPGYGFEKHKGYGTKDHIGAIKKLGLTPLHRRSFTGKFA